MLTVTEPAVAHLADMLVEAEAPDDVAIRFVIQEQGLALGLDNERPGDATYAHGERTVLLLDEQVTQLLADKTLDVEDTAEGPRLALS